MGERPWPHLSLLCCPWSPFRNLWKLFNRKHVLLELTRMKIKNSLPKSVTSIYCISYHHFLNITINKELFVSQQFFCFTVTHEYFSKNTMSFIIPTNLVHFTPRNYFLNKHTLRLCFFRIYWTHTHIDSLYTCRWWWASLFVGC